MRSRRQKHTVAWHGIAAVLTALLLVPSIARAQGDLGNPASAGGSSSTISSEIADKRVSLVVDEENLATALRKLMQTVSVDYVIDAALKEAVVSVHLTNVRFETALNAVIKSSSLPVVLKIENGVYRLSLRPETPSTPDLPAPRSSAVPKPVGMETIRMNYADAVVISQILHGYGFETYLPNLPVTPNYGVISNGNLDRHGDYTSSTVGTGGVHYSSGSWNGTTSPNGVSSGSGGGFSIGIGQNGRITFSGLGSGQRGGGRR